ncbi:MAG TPA: serine/threonine protein phosphatase [Deltaproteobacteria bacterium]|nr:serine/threonine protein phosphatase [Deltaproteobacteria bacterium]
MNRTFAIGDIHGCLGKLEDLIARIEPEKDDLLIFLGDYIDRGTDVREVIDFLIDLAIKIPCIFLRGNHEDMFLEFLEFGTNRTMFFANGGLKTIDSYIRPSSFVSHDQVAMALPETHRDFYASMKWYYEDPGYIYVHAGMKPHISMQEQERQDMIWIRDDFIFSGEPLEKKVIFGHTPFARPFVKQDKIGIDTGAVYGGCLTAVELPQETFVRSYR